jgi:hypothetical protein
VPAATWISPTHTQPSNKPFTSSDVNHTSGHAPSRWPATPSRTGPVCEPPEQAFHVTSMSPASHVHTPPNPLLVHPSSQTPTAVHTVQQCSPGPSRGTHSSNTQAVTLSPGSTVPLPPLHNAKPILAPSPRLAANRHQPPPPCDKVQAPSPLQAPKQLHPSLQRQQQITKHPKPNQTLSKPTPQGTRSSLPIK